MVNSDHTLFALDSKPTLGGGSCWSAVTPDGHWLYTANSASNSISGYGITNSGAISPVQGTIVAQLPNGTTDLDMAVSADGKYLYSVNGSAGTVGIYTIKTDGTLQIQAAHPAFTPVTGFNGIAAY
jgi:6-phosphogluconolactonase (cycloisomerase 2 family)